MGKLRYCACAPLLQSTLLTHKKLHSYSPTSSESESESSSSDESDEDESIITKHVPRDLGLGFDEDEDSPGQASTTYTKTLNEIVEDDIVIPEISEVDPYEPLEQVGEIFSILNNKIVVVKGMVSHTADRVAETALDSETLLLFEDRKVMGFVSFGQFFRDPFDSFYADIRDIRTHVSTSIPSSIQ
jgi:hypothetical protein